MSEFDLDAELANLLKGIQPEKQKYKGQAFFVSIESERQEIIESFYDHAMSVHSLHEDITPETMFDAPSMDDIQKEYKALEELVAVDIGQHEALVQGEYRISGEGIFMSFPQDLHETDRTVLITEEIDDEDSYGEDDDSGFSIEILDDGDTLRGEISHYEVIPTVSYEELSHLKTNDIDDAELITDEGVPGVWVSLKNVTQYDTSGIEIRTFGSVMVPFTVAGLQFEKAEYQFEELAPKIDSEQLGREFKEKFSGSLFREHCNDIENDLNHNGYSDDEIRAKGAEYLEELGYYIKDVKPGEEMLLTALDGIDPKSKDQVMIIEQKVYYNAPTLLSISDSWRVVHSFYTITAQGAAPRVVNVLPENILSIERITY